jgi:hypothetical protein
MSRTSIIAAALGAAALIPAAATAKPMISPIGSAPVTYAARAGAQQLPADVTMPAMRNTRNAQQSQNWGGYIDSIRNPRNAFQSVGSTFRVPTVNVLTTTDGPGGNMAAQWVGLDGTTANSPTVEQTGVSEWLDSNFGIPHYEAWWEMFPIAPVTIGDVAAGDLIRANVHAYGPSVPAGFVLTLTDQTQHWSNVSAFRFTNVTPPRNSSEVITEVPSSSGGAMDLTDYGNVRYSNSGTSTNSTPHSLASNSAYTAHKVILVDSVGDTMAAVSNLNHGSAFSTPFVSNGNN